MKKNTASLRLCILASCRKNLCLLLVVGQPWALATPDTLIQSGIEGTLRWVQGFPGGAMVKNPPANAGDTGLSPGPGRSHMPRSN